MKWKPVLCVAVLALAAGCQSQQNPYASFGEYGFSYDLEQAPVPGLTVAENDRIARMPAASPTQLWTPTLTPAPTPATFGQEPLPTAKPDNGSGVPSPVAAPTPAPAEAPTMAPATTPAQ